MKGKNLTFKRGDRVVHIRDGKKGTVWGLEDMLIAVHLIIENDDGSTSGIDPATAAQKLKLLEPTPAESLSGQPPRSASA